MPYYTQLVSLPSHLGPGKIDPETTLGTKEHERVLAEAGASKWCWSSSFVIRMMAV